MNFVLCKWDGRLIEHNTHTQIYIYIYLEQLNPKKKRDKVPNPGYNKFPNEKRDLVTKTWLLTHPFHLAAILDFFQRTADAIPLQWPWTQITPATRWRWAGICWEWSRWNRALWSPCLVVLLLAQGTPRIPHCWIWFPVCYHGWPLIRLCWT